MCSSCTVSVSWQLILEVHVLHRNVKIIICLFLWYSLYIYKICTYTHTHILHAYLYTFNLYTPIFSYHNLSHSIWQAYVLTFWSSKATNTYCPPQVWLIPLVDPPLSPSVWHLSRFYLTAASPSTVLSSVVSVVWSSPGWGKIIGMLKLRPITHQMFEIISSNILWNNVINPKKS